MKIVESVKLSSKLHLFKVILKKNMPNLRSEIFLIGYEKDQLTGSKLPSQLDCLKLLFHYLRNEKLSVKESARLVIQKCSIFWEKARIPVQQSIKAEKKLMLLYNEWRKLSKHKTINSDFYKVKRETWKISLNNLFDMAHANALNLMKIEEDKQFLIKQRSKGREGCMLGIDVNFTNKEDTQKNARNKKKLERNSHKKVRQHQKVYIRNKL